MNLESLSIQKAKINQFKKKGINTIEELANFIPRKYNDLAIKDLSHVEENEFATAVLKAYKITSTPQYVQMRCIDSYGRWINVTTFNKFQGDNWQEGLYYFVAGKVKRFNQFINISSPEICEVFTGNEPKIQSVYSKITGMSNDFLVSNIDKALDILKNEPDYLESSLCDKYKLPSRNESLQKIHHPQSFLEVKKAQDRMIFDNLFFYNFKIRSKIINEKSTSHIIPQTGNLTKKALKALPYKLTSGSLELMGQIEVIRELLTQAKNGNRINALVQGDVGSGKTMVAFFSMLAFVEAGYQAVLMAPTQVLAEQHYNDMKNLFEPLDLKIGYISGNTKAKEKKELISGISNGTINFIVGTHAILSDSYTFHNLGILVTDEEHKFGVLQREGLLKKVQEGVHSITMSATPIPRSLALSIYGKALDVYTIKVLPSGRKPIKTTIISNVESTYNFMYRQIEQGRQCYVVCPLIENSDSERLADVESIEDNIDSLNSYFSPKGVSIGVITGKMDKKEIDSIIQDFKNQEYQILLATTIIEVGVNVPNSTVMLIKNSERFGLAQLHQLRGRVGRGSFESFCFLHVGTEDYFKLKIMEKTSDGFEIAMEDLKNRGVGDFFGSEQTGDNKSIELMLKYEKLNTLINKDIDEIFQNEERFKRYNNVINVS